jgi:hypothetical protein
VVDPFDRFVVGLTSLHSVSLGYFPPSSNYEQLGVFAKKFPIYRYQLYFASTTCSAELERNVRTVSMFETAKGSSLISADPADHEFLQIFVPYERFFGS